MPLDGEQHGAQLPTVGEPVCRTCGAVAEYGYAHPLCVQCRTKFVGRPFPKWIMVVGILVLCAVVFSSTRIPEAMGAAIAFERGQKDERAARYDAAAVEYAKTAAQFSDSTVATGRLGLAFYKSGRFYKARLTLQKLSGRKIRDTELLGELNEAIGRMNSR